MIDLPFISLDLVRGIIQNFTIIATLVLLYSFIPDTLRSRSRFIYSLAVGTVFGIAAAVSIPTFWLATIAPVLGLNVILVPLAGFAAGPVSAVIVAVPLLAGVAVSKGTLAPADILTVMSGVLLGSLFWYARTWSRFPKKARIQLLLLGIGIAAIEASSFAITNWVQGPAATPVSDGLPFLSIVPFLLASGIVTIFLGSIIVFIDRKKQAEKELLQYKDHLEDLVRKRTSELRQASSLQRAAIESTADGIVIVDTAGVIRAYNQKAAHILKLPRHLPKESEGAGKFSTAIQPRLSDPEGFLRLITPLPESAEQIITANLEFENGRIYELFVQPQRVGDRMVGRVYSLHDITEQRHAEDAIRTANNKLVLLSNISRHDILNQMTALSGYLELAQEKLHESPVAGYLDSMKKTIEIIRLHVEFTRDYQDLGLQKPVWQNVKNTFLNAAEPFAGQKIVIRCDTGDLEIYADHLIGRGFYNLIDNSLRHGEHISEIRLSATRAGSDLLLVYEDDGIGVAHEEKEKIFAKGFGKHTGLGMFLIREILSITGITIHENGTYGKGIRFEIRIPPGKFRLTS